MVTKYSVAMGLIVRSGGSRPLDKGGGGHPDPEIMGDDLKKFFFDLSGFSLVQKPNLKLVSRSYRFSDNTKQWKKTEPPRFLSRWTVMGIQK